MAILVRVLVTLVVFLSQFAPEFVVLKTTPVSPEINPVLPENFMQNKLPVVFKIILLHFKPPSVEFKTVPFNPQANPVFSFKKKTDLMLFFV